MDTKNKTQYLTDDKLKELQEELRNLKEEKIPNTAQRIDDARQMGDLSENAEYHQAREDMAWAQSRVKELENIISNAEIINQGVGLDKVNIGSTIVVKANKVLTEYTIVGPQEADPLKGKISNESPLGQAFLGKRKGDKVEIKVPAGEQTYKIVEIR